jgi:hypothetical protein
MSTLTPPGALGKRSHKPDQTDFQRDKMRLSPYRCHLIVVQICSQVDKLFRLEDLYNSSPVLYQAIGGPNSNSLAHWFLISDGLDDYFTVPPSTGGIAGWDTSIYR